ncbi:MAG: hypothetical protein AAFQ35_14695 [Pseudomonadota bacterium]
MALNKNHLARTGSWSGPRSTISKWGYATDDASAVVEAGNYFLEAHGFLSVGDQIDVSLDLDGTPAMKSYVVTASSQSTVTIAAAA